IVEAFRKEFDIKPAEAAAAVNGIHEVPLTPFANGESKFRQHARAHPPGQDPIARKKLILYAQAVSQLNAQTAERILAEVDAGAENPAVREYRELFETLASFGEIGADERAALTRKQAELRLSDQQARSQEI
ncbi:MAG: hypothetical protein M3Y07_11240, partial [Acidobacteriota bacterium]|nr:hypothetical protein [Acidobacteriota bacterium]